MCYSTRLLKAYGLWRGLLGRRPGLVLHDLPNPCPMDTRPILPFAGLQGMSLHTSAMEARAVVLIPLHQGDQQGQPL